MYIIYLNCGLHELISFENEFIGGAYTVGRKTSLSGNWSVRVRLYPGVLSASFSNAGVASPTAMIILAWGFCKLLKVACVVIIVTVDDSKFVLGK